MFEPGWPETVLDVGGGAASVEASLELAARNARQRAVPATTWLLTALGWLAVLGAAVVASASGWRPGRSGYGR